MALCPYCKSPLKGKQAFPILPPRQLRIYDAVVAAGRDGLFKEDLLKILYDGKKIPPGGPIVLRVTIHELNKAIKSLDQRIVGRHGYRLVKAVV